MRTFVLFALLATAFCANSGDNWNNHDGQSIWQTGQVYEYEVEARTMSALGDREWQGVELRARFVLAAQSDGRLLARLADVRQARLQRLPEWNAPAADEPQYRPVTDLQRTFQIRTEGGRVLEMRVPADLAHAHENLLKGLTSALQVDLSDKHLIKSAQNYYNERAASGSFRKMETDVTGRCEVLYAVAPLDDETLAVDKTNDYRNCDERALYNFGAYPRAWNRHGEEDLVHQSTFARYVISRRNATVQSACATTKVAVAPVAHGARDGNVVSEVRLQLVAVSPDSAPEQLPSDARDAGSLLYTLARRDEQPERTMPGRFRRNADQPRDNTIGKNQKPRQSSSSSESDEVDEAAEYRAAAIESSIADLLVAVYPRDDEESLNRVKETIRSIARDLRSPNEMPKADTLAKYYIVERTLESMSDEQMAAIAKEFEANRSGDADAQLAWTVCRDSVVQAGTPAAFRQIKSWISSKKLRGEEAAQLVSTLASTLRYPTEKIMAEFFELAVHADVRKERQLHASALLAATRFINAGHVDNSSAHYRYPTHVYGRLAHKRYPIVYTKIVPYFKRELKAAMQKGATDLAQLYVKAIGNIGHEAILEILAPYLEGKLPSTTFMRAHIVRNLYRLAKQEPHAARAVLYRIYKNRAEEYEVRVAAVHTLMKAHPTPAMLQEMAADTCSNDHVQVRSVIKNAIQHAARLDSKPHEKLAKAARAAQNFLTEEDFGHQYSAKYYNDYESDYYNEDESDELGHFQAYSQTGSEDSLFPKQFSYSLKNKVGQWQKSIKLGGAVSSWSHFFDIIQSNKMSRILGQPKSLKWSAENIAKALNIQGWEGEPFNANFLMQAFQQQRFFAFNEEFIKSIEQNLVNKYNELTNGVNYKYTKMYNSEQFEIMFPLSMGMPFVFRYRVPTVVSVHGSVKSNGKWMASQKFGLSGNFEAVIARNYDGEYGFFNTIDNKIFTNGISTKCQIYFPAKYKFEINTKTGKFEMELAPLKPDTDANIMHYSYWPYAAYQKLGSQTPVSQEPETYVYRNENSMNKYEKVYGKSYTGMAFHIGAYSESTDFHNTLNGKPFDRKISSYLCHIFAQKQIAVTDINLKYSARDSSSKKFVATYAYDNNNRQQAEGNANQGEEENLKDYVPTESTPDNKNRQNEMLQRVASDIKYAKAVIHDIGFQFHGPEKYEYTMTYTHASSPVDKKSQMIFFCNMNAANKQYQFLATAQSQNPNRPMIDFQKVLNDKANADMLFHMRFGPKVQSGGHVEIRAKFESTDEYRQALSQDKQFREYFEREGKNALDSETLIHMYKPFNYNLITGEVSYKNIEHQTRFYTHQAYNIIRHHIYHYYEEKYPSEKVKDGQINFRFHLSNDFDRLNISMDTQNYDARVMNLPIDRIVRQAIQASQPSLSKSTIVGDVMTGGQYNPMCALDRQYVNTYDNYRYEYEPEKNVWYMLTQYGAIPNQHEHSTPAEQAVVLVRDNEKKQKELQIYYRSPQGEQPVTVELLPNEDDENAAYQIILNGQQQEISQNKVAQLWSEVEDAPLVQAYALPEGAIVVNIANGQLRVVYNDKAFYLYTSGDYRNATSGLCGTMSGDRNDDFLVPDGGYVEDPRVFAAYYVVPDTQNPKSIELQQYAQTVASTHPQHMFTAIYPYHEALYPNRYSRRHGDDSSSSSSSSYSTSHSVETEDENEHENYQQNDDGVAPRSYAPQRGPCKLEHQVQYVEKNGQICITYQPVAACSQRCRGEKHQAYPAKVSCKSAKDQKYRMYKDQIKRGQNPQLDEAHNQPTGETIFKAPTVCKA
uniref:Vitellogenin n=1 Tax=Thitarodes pui TaxID=507567 RepID=A0A2S1XV30_THIPU|nr:vitellogenin [Thitarodes pui]